MNRREERQLFEEVHENNIMLHQICDVINVHLARFHQENEDDFNRNVLANLISGGMNFEKLGRR
jgi:hypothetical protein